jgi:hypothetical protein
MNEARHVIGSSSEKHDIEALAAEVVGGGQGLGTGCEAAQG